MLMKLCWILAFAALAAACSATDACAQGITASNPLPPGAIVLQRSVIPDPGVIGQGPAMYVMLPLGWRGQGGVQMYRRPCAEPFGVNWSASSPDGRSSVAIFPTELWQWSNTGTPTDCPPGSHANIRDYLAHRAAQMFPGARVLDYRARPDYAKAAEERVAIFRQAAAATGTDMRAWADGGEVLFAFDQNGTEMRGVLGASGKFYSSELFNPMGGEPLRILAGETLGTFGAIAPAGQLDFTLIEAVRRSVTPDPRWLEAYFEFQAKLGNMAVDNTRQRAAMIVAGGAEATQQNIATYRAMAGASIQSSRESIEAQMRPAAGASTSRELFPGDLAGDRMQRESVEAIRGVETYADPIAGGNVQLDATYDHAWRINGDDAYILTNDPNFNPAQYGFEATQMRAVE
jgi:hypothetical protein